MVTFANDSYKIAPEPWQSIDGATLFSTSVWNIPHLPSKAEQRH